MRLLKLLVLLCGTVLLARASASTVSASTSSPSGGTVTTTITVTPGSGESVRDFHLKPLSGKKKLPPGASLGGPSGWPQGSSGSDGWASWGSGSSSSGELGSAGSFTITVPSPHGLWSTFK